MEHNLFRFKLDVVSLPVALNKTTTCTSRHHQAYLTWGTSPPHAHRHGEQHHHHMHHQTYLKHEQHHHLHHNNHTAFEFWRPDLSFYHILVPIGYRATALSDASVCLAVRPAPHRNPVGRRPPARPTRRPTKRKKACLLTNPRPAPLQTYPRVSGGGSVTERHTDASERAVARYPMGTRI